MTMSRRTFLKMALRACGAVTAASVGSMLYAVHVEPYLVRIERMEIPLPRLPRWLDDGGMIHRPGPTHQRPECRLHRHHRRFRHHHQLPHRAGTPGGVERPDGP